MSGIEARDIVFSYTTQPLFDGLNIKVDAGEFVGLVGPNGSGKTTFLNLVTRVLKPSSGQIFVDGDEIRSFSARALACKIAVVPQESTIIFPFTVSEVVLMGRAPHLRSMLERDEDFDTALEAMETTGVAHLADRQITSLSGGERQSVLIARALAQRPSILLLDEPTAFLDIKHQVDIYEILTRLNREHQMTIIAVSHDLNLASHYCERVLVFKQGKLMFDGLPEEAITAETIRDVYGADVVVQKNPRNGRPFVLPMRRQPKDNEGGGGSR
ncbi:MAG: heme ABC transporter ATP-binding protein [Candidatus Hydrogenedentota bacterium]|nr:MAG: heme ABC transporter ATP-binding protein [Candidatus Hydrogenedentota bacterium]